MRYTDAEFTEELRSYLDVKLGDESLSAAVPVFYLESGAVNRQKTLELDVFDGMTEQKKRELSQ